MSTEFDAYYTWLGIAPKDQPPHYYKLLGLEPFESHPDVISNAADRQMAHVRTFQAGKQATLSQRLLNEISQARVCLLDLTRKHVYDQQLRAKISTTDTGPAPLATAPRPEPPAAAPSGAALGEYLLLDQLAAGRTGQVFQAKHRTLGRVVAIKTLSSEAAANREQVRRFLRKAKILGQISSPHLIAAHDAGERDGVFYLIMEYVPGHDLSQHVKDGHPLPVAEVVGLLAQAAEGLSALHAAGVVHRNVKPGNLWLGNDGRVRVIGLGLAKLGADDVVEREPENSELTEVGRMMGTLDYMSPEQALDSHVVDARSDIYSLGCVLYTSLTGRFVYPEKSVIKKALAHRSGPIPMLGERRPEVSAALEAVYQKLMAKQPAQRFQTMQEVANALRRAVS